MTSPAEAVLTAVAEACADIGATTRNAIDAIRETAATSQESYALAPPQPGTFIHAVGCVCVGCGDVHKSPAPDLDSLGLGSVIWASAYRPERGTVRMVLVKSPRTSGLPWICEDAAFRSSQLSRVEVLHPGIDVPS